jgi:DNA polymerase I-like protein with 3'-5' exonuclease and polymerase domains
VIFRLNGSAAIDSKPQVRLSLKLFRLAARLSGDEKLWEAYSTGDPYLAFAIQAELAPAGATKQTHKRERNLCKIIMLGVQYGMSAFDMATRAGIPIKATPDGTHRIAALPAIPYFRLLF